MKHYHWLLAGLLLPATLLQGCFVIKANVEWELSNGELMAHKDHEHKPYLSGITLSRKPHMIVIPFFFVLYSNKSYGLEFYFTNRSNFGRIDSVSYSVYDHKDSLLIADQTQYHNKFWRESSLGNPPPDSGPDTLYFLTVHTPYTHQLVIKDEKLLRIKVKVCTTSLSGKSTELSYDLYTLERDGKRIGSFF